MEPTPEDLLQMLSNVVVHPRQASLARRGRVAEQTEL